jgi:hypothetical protein
MKIIIQLGVALALLLSSLLGLAESKADKIYDMYSGRAGFTTLSFSRSTLAPYEIFFDDNTKTVVEKIDRVRFLVYDQKKGKHNNDEVFDRAVSVITAPGYFFIDPSEIDCRDCSNNWNDNDLRIVGFGSRAEMSELHIIVVDKETVALFSFYGKLSMDEINNCMMFSNSSKFNISM